MYRILIALIAFSIWPSSSAAVPVCPEGGVLYHDGDAVGCFYTPSGLDRLGMSISEVCPVSVKGYTLQRSSAWSKPSRFLRNGIGCLTCIHTSHNDLPGTDTVIAANALKDGDYSGFQPSLDCLMTAQKEQEQVRQPINRDVQLAEVFVGPRFCLKTYDDQHFLTVDQIDNRKLTADADSCDDLEIMNIWFLDNSDPVNPEWKDGYPVPANALVRIKNATGAYLVRNKIGGLQGNNPDGQPERAHFRVNRVVTAPGTTAMQGVLKAGDVITLQSVVSNQFVVAEDGGGGQANANRDQAVTWERFKLVDPN